MYVESLDRGMHGGFQGGLLREDDVEVSVEDQVEVG